MVARGSVGKRPRSAGRSENLHDHQHAREKLEAIYRQVLTDLKTSEQALAEDLHDPAFRREWDRTAVARAVALKVLAYRTEHGLSQRALAKKLGMTQPRLARLEAGEHNPTIDTLARLAQTLDVEFAIDVHPRQRTPRLLSGRARRGNAIASYQTDTGTILLAAD